MPTASELFNQARAVHQAGDPARAEPLYRRALESDPSLVLAWYLRGVALQMLGRLDEAVESLRRALVLKPDHVDALNLRGVICARRTQLADAVACFRESIRLRPGAADIHNNLCLALAKLGELDDAIAAGQRAIAVRPDYADAHVNLGFTLLEFGALDQAVSHYRSALALRPEAHSTHSGLLFALNYDPRLSPPALCDEHRAWASRHGAVPFAGSLTGHDRAPDRSLRVGYVSPNLRTHPVASFLEPILGHHDKSRFQVVCYSDTPNPDGVTTRLQSLASGWRSTQGMSDAQLSALIRQDGIDILVDLAGHSAGNRLVVFAGKPAPVQVTYLGYPNTTGLAAVDYLVTDNVVDPEGEVSPFIERPLRLPGGFCVFSPPSNAPPVAPSPCERTGVITFGSLHKPTKLNHEVLELWIKLLHNVPSSRLILARNTFKGGCASEILGMFGASAIDPARIEIRHALEGVGPHLKIYDEIDLSLDVFPWCGHTTACESLWMGVPIVTLRGDRHAGRMTASVLTALGMTDLIAETPEQYLAIAAHWAADPELLARRRRELRSLMQASPLCDGLAFTQTLEAAYRTIWQTWCAQSG